MKKKNPLILPALIFLVFVLCSILFYVFYSYQKTGFVKIAQWGEVYDYNGKLLLSKKDDFALLVKTLGKTDFLVFDKSFGYDKSLFHNDTGMTYQIS